MKNNLQIEQDTTTTSTLEERLQNTAYCPTVNTAGHLAQSTYKHGGGYIPPITQSPVTQSTWHWFTIKNPPSYFRF